MLMERVSQVIGAITIPFFLIGLFGNIWTLYVVVKTQIAAIVDVRFYFIAIFGSDLTIQLVMGIDLLVSNLLQIFSDQYESIALLGDMYCRTQR